MPIGILAADRNGPFENLSFCALVGFAAGHKSPDLTGTLEVSLTF
jgi:hypothetical protein